MNNILLGDCIDQLKTLEDNSVDSIVTDPPYGLSFMGKKWDYDVPSKEVWQECLRVLKPGGYLLAFAGTRTQHRMAVNIEDAGFEIRDMIAWVYGSGFPKSLNIGKALDRAAGELLPENKGFTVAGFSHNDKLLTTAPSKGYIQPKLKTDEAKQWEGWGTALKPALEPITVSRKPLSEKTVAENVLKWGTGGINIDGSRVETEDNLNGGAYSGGERSEGDWKDNSGFKNNKLDEYEQPQGRFPANLIHDGSDEVVSLFPDTKSGSKFVESKRPRFAGWREMEGREDRPAETSKIDNYGDSGSAARFFKSVHFPCPYANLNCPKCNAKPIIYQPKASKADRDEGLEGFEDKQVNKMGSFGNQEGVEQSDGANRTGDKGSARMRNHHPTVKPTKLMQYLVKLVTPKGGVVLDPFMGSGSTGKACKLEGFDFIGIEREPEYVEIAKARIEAVQSTLL